MPGVMPEGTKKAEAALGAVLTQIAAEGDLEVFLARVDWHRAGVSKEWLVHWVLQHQAHGHSRRDSISDADLVRAVKDLAEKVYTGRDDACVMLTPAQAGRLALLAETARAERFEAHL